MKALVLPLLLSVTALAADPYTERVPDTKVRFDMVPVPGGTFRMGSPATEKGRKPDEGPQFEVEIEPFFIGKYEVTWGEYEAFTAQYHSLAAVPWDQKVTIPADKFADAVTYPTPIFSIATDEILDQRGGRGPDMPAVSMSQFAARQYTKWLSKKTGRFYRLPTEAEWEYACRAGTTTAYSFGDDPAELKHYAWDFDQQGDEWKFHRVGTKKPNPWGLYDMHGNVAEWCLDAYSADWYARFAGKKVKATDVINWPSRRYPRVFRGGHYEAEPQDCRSAARKGSDKQMNLYDAQIPQSPHWEAAAFWVGFRVVSPAKEPTEEEKRRCWDVDDDVTREVLKRDREVHELIPPPAGVPRKQG